MYCEHADRDGGERPSFVTMWRVASINTCGPGLYPYQDKMGL
jgi:hypothetical protein